MKDCKYFQQLIVEDYYDEIKPKEKSKLFKHFENCDCCKVQFSQIQSTLNGMNQYERPHPSEKFWDNYWINLESKLEQKPSFSERLKKIFSIIQIKPSWIYGFAAAATLLIIGIFIGRSSFTPQSQDPYITTGISQKNIRTVATAERYLQRSKVLLLGIVNMDTKIESKYIPNISKQQQISKELIQQTAVLKKDLKNTDQRILLELINELETILMQIANLEKENDYNAIELIQSSLDRKGILVKINLGQIISEANRANSKSIKPKKKQI